MCLAAAAPFVVAGCQSLALLIGIPGAFRKFMSFAVISGVCQDWLSIRIYYLTHNGPAIKVGCVGPDASGPWRIFCVRFPAKNVTNNLPLLSVLALAFYFFL
jgi:hypothetical protein